MATQVLILGANGQLGCDLVHELSKSGVDFTPLARDQFDVLKDDISLLDQYKPKYIINCVATTNVDGCEDNSKLAFDINANFTYQLAKYCKSNNIILFHISTDYVFDGTNEKPYTEKSPAQPLNIYGLSKYAGDLAINAYHDKYFIFRVSSLFGVAGASGKGGNFITTMVRLGGERDRLDIIADQITCPTATLDIARAICHFIINKIDDFGIYNCVSSNSCSWFEFTQAIFTAYDMDINKLHKADFASYKFKAKRPQYGVLSIEKLSKYYMMPTWQESLQEYVANFKQ